MDESWGSDCTTVAKAAHLRKIGKTNSHDWCFNNYPSDLLLSNLFFPHHFHRKIKYNPVSKWTKFDLLSKGARRAAVLVLQMNWGTLNNLVINSPVPALVIFSDMTNWSDPGSQALTLPLLSFCCLSLVFSFFLLSSPHPSNPQITFSFYCLTFSGGSGGLNGAMASAYQSRRWHPPVAFPRLGGANSA